MLLLLLPVFLSQQSRVSEADRTEGALKCYALVHCIVYRTFFQKPCSKMYDKILQSLVLNAVKVVAYRKYCIVRLLYFMAVRVDERPCKIFC